MKALIILILAMVLYISCRCQYVSRGAAEQVVKTFIAERMRPPGREIDFNLSSRQPGNAGRSDMYHVFSLSPTGFVIVSADRRAGPVLAYSLESTYDPEKFPESWKDWMDQYTQAIKAVSEGAEAADKNSQSRWDHYLAGNTGERSPAECQPLLYSLWHQDHPYNLECPPDINGPGGRAYAGCVATAMSQVLYYYRYPATGQGSKTYHLIKYGDISVDFSGASYDFDAMVNKICLYNNPELAKLIYHCGVSIETNYSASGSSAVTSNVADALAQYFRYDSSIYYQARSDTASWWSDSLVSNLDRGMPLIYRGGNLGMGHAWVCDGYADDLFHFNWGWGGWANGYYSIDIITPGPYNLSGMQAAIFGIKPSETTYYPCEFQDTLCATAGTIKVDPDAINCVTSMSASWLIDPTEQGFTNIMCWFDQVPQNTGDRIVVYDGPDNQAEVLWDSHSAPRSGTMISQADAIYIEANLDNGASSPGFFFSYYSFSGTLCPQQQFLSSPEGWIYDGSWYLDYVNDSDCSWLIAPSDEMHDSISSIVIEFSELDIEIHDTLFIHDGPDGNAPLLAALNGNSMPPPIISANDTVYLNFRSDSYGTAGGWLATYYSILPEYCADTIVLKAASGTLNDGSGDKFYQDNADCYWLISPEPPGEVYLDFEEFDLEYGYDRLSVYDAGVDPNTLLGTFSGKETPPVISVASGKILLHFQSDETIHYDGWKVHYSVLNLSSDPLEPTVNAYLYPVPATDRLFLELSGWPPSGSLTISISDITGHQVYKGRFPVSGHKIEIPINEMKPGAGAYILNISGDRLSLSKKFVHLKQ